MKKANPELLLHEQKRKVELDLIHLEDRHITLYIYIYIYIYIWRGDVNYDDSPGKGRKVMAGYIRVNRVQILKKII